MSHLTRLLFIVSFFGMLYLIGAAVTMHQRESVVIAVILLVVAVKRWKRKRLTTLGSARWANWNDLNRAAMLDGNSGLILGRLMGVRGPWGQLRHAILALFLWRVSSRQACFEMRDTLTRGRAPMVRMPAALHTACFAPTGKGKGTSFVIPFLLTCAESAVVIDYKGENFKLTAEHRRSKFGQRIVVIDPYRVVTDEGDCFDPLTFIGNGSETIDDVRDLSDALVVRDPNERDPHFNDACAMFISAIILTVVLYGNPSDGTRSLQTVSDILSNPQKLDIAIKLMLESKLCGGLVARIGAQLTHFIEKEKASTLTTAARHLAFLSTQAIAEMTKGTSFDPALLLQGKMTIYIVLPPNHARAQSGLLRMLITSLLRTVVKGGLQERNKVHFVLDEASSLGHLEAIDEALDRYRAYGVRLLFIYQSLGQLRTCFPNGADQTFLSNTSQIFFAVNDQALPGGTGTADYVSARLGEFTEIVDSGSTSRGLSGQHSTGQQGSGSTSWSTNSTSSWQQQARKLLKPEEVVALPQRMAITFTPGVRPICTWLPRYYEKNWLGIRKDRFVTSCLTFLAAAIICVVVIGASKQATDRLTEWHEASIHNSQPEVPARRHYVRPRKPFVRRDEVDGF